MAWRYAPWDLDETGAANRTAVPEAGGWIYRLRGGEGTYSHVFVPDLTVWASYIAVAFAAAEETAIQVHLDLGAVQHGQQPVPN